MRKVNILLKVPRGAEYWGRVGDVYGRVPLRPELGYLNSPCAKSGLENHKDT